MLVAIWASGFEPALVNREIPIWSWRADLSTTKSSKPKSARSLKREIAALRSTLGQVGAALVDIDDASLREVGYRCC